MGGLQFNPKTMPLRKGSSPLKSGGAGNKSNGGGCFFMGRSCCLMLLVGAAMIAFTVYVDQEMVRNLNNENPSQLIRKPVEYLSNLASDGGFGETEGKADSSEMSLTEDSQSDEVANEGDNFAGTDHESADQAEDVAEEPQSEAEIKQNEVLVDVDASTPAEESENSQGQESSEAILEESNNPPVEEADSTQQSSEGESSHETPVGATAAEEQSGATPNDAVAGDEQEAANDSPAEQVASNDNPTEQESEVETPGDINEQAQATANDDSPDKPKLYLHVGPQKTGSSSLQTALDVISELTYRIEDDNLVYDHITPETGSFDCELGPWGGFINCVVSDKLKGLMSHTHNSGQNLLLTDENLGDRFVGPLRDAIDSNEWDITVVVVYRRIHEWLVSWWNQINKTTNLDAEGKILIDSNGNPYREKHKLWPNEGGVYVPEFTAWYKEYIKFWDASDLVGHHRSVEYYNLYKNVFDNVQVYNMHSGGDIVTDFFCDVIDTPNACKKLENHEVEMSEVNTSVNLYHDILATYFYDQGLVAKGLSRQHVVTAIGDYVKRTKKEIPRKCDDAVINQIFGWLVGSEKIMLKESWTDSSEDDLRTLFDSYVANGKICDLDREGVLQDEEWQSFFRSLGGGQEDAANIS
ncbi:MAG: hypothetical protein SGILL_005411 [Bacillariaceae sp.]